MHAFSNFNHYEENVESEIIDIHFNLQKIKKWRKLKQHFLNPDRNILP